MSGMYPDAKTWNPFLGCKFDCVYCEKSFKRMLKRVGRNIGCDKCYHYIPHTHPERLKRIPSFPIVFVFGQGDIYFCPLYFIGKTFIAIEAHKPRKPKIYYFQSKSPSIFNRYLSWFQENSDKAILLTTLETNRDGISLEWFLQVKHRATLKLIEYLISHNPNLTRDQICRLKTLINEKNIVAQLNIEKSRGQITKNGIASIEKKHVNILENITKNTKMMKGLKNARGELAKNGILNKSVNGERNLRQSEERKQNLIMPTKSGKDKSITQRKDGNLLEAEKINVRNAVSQILESLKFTTLEGKNIKKILCSLQNGKDYGFCVQTAIKLFTLLDKNLNSKGYREISNAPFPSIRFYDFYELDYSRKVLTIEPVLDFDLDEFADMVVKLHRQGSLEYVWFGFDSKNCGLPEPSIEKAQRFVDILQDHGIEVRGKLLRGVKLREDGK